MCNNFLSAMRPWKKLLMKKYSPQFWYRHHVFDKASACDPLYLVVHEQIGIEWHIGLDLNRVTIFVRQTKTCRYSLWPLAANTTRLWRHCSVPGLFSLWLNRLHETSHFRIQFNKLRITFHLLKFFVWNSSNDKVALGLFPNFYSVFHCIHAESAEDTSTKSYLANTQVSFKIRRQQQQNMFLYKKFDFAVSSAKCACSVEPTSIAV